MLDVSTVQKHLTTKDVGRKLVYKSITGTTMDDAAQAAKLGGGHGVAYVADTQTNARGSKGRSWDAHSSGNIYISFIIHRPADKDKPVPERHLENDIELSASLASLTVLQNRGVQEVKVKWLNDLWVRGHKLLGALAEFKGQINVEGKEKYLYILGIGLNLNSDMRHDSELRGLATSTFCETGQTFPREEVVADICNHLEIFLAKPRQELMDLYNQHAALKTGDNLKVYFTDTSLLSKVCKYRGIDENWSVILEDKDGQQFGTPSAEVSVRQHPSKAIYVLNDALVEGWSYTLLMKMCYSLVDTMEFDVKSITVEAFQKGSPADCKLFVIGQLSGQPKDQTWHDMVDKYQQGGGACLCIGNACSLFTGPNTQEVESVQSSKPYLTSVQTSSTDSNQANVVSCNSNISSTASISQLNNHNDTQSRTIIAKFTKNPTVTITDAVSSKQAGDSAANALADNLAERANVQDNTISTENQNHVQNHVGKDSDAGDGHIQGNDAVCVFRRAGIDAKSGVLCLCLPNIEVAYTDVKSYFPDQMYLKESLQSTVYTQDCLFQHILHACGI